MEITKMEYSSVIEGGNGGNIFEVHIRTAVGIKCYKFVQKKDFISQLRTNNLIL